MASPVNAFPVNAAANLEGFYITQADYVRTVPMTELPDTILEKINSAKPLLKSDDSDIPVGKYDKIYVTSDIHSDLNAISRILFKADLITADVTDADSVFGIRWNPLKSKTLLVIVGDIVDGNRGDDSVHDAVGDIEILLHIFLYNLRVSARSYESELRFVIGNHDYHTVIQEKHLDPAVIGNDPEPYGRATRGVYYSAQEVFYKNYVHRSARVFFGETDDDIDNNTPGVFNVSRINRRNCLTPFYQVCPYVTITVGNEIIFIHASLHGGNKGQFDLTDKLLELQLAIDSNGLLETIGTYIPGETDKYIKFIANSNNNNLYSSPLWSRFYSSGTTANVCGAVSASEYKLTVVGHCQTNSCDEYGNHMRDILERPEYLASQCKAGGGCVLLGCSSPDQGPRLAFVDISMSAAFADKKGEREEILLLEHMPDTGGGVAASSVKVAPLPQVNKRYYDKITRINTLATPIDIIVVWEAPVPVIGGRRKYKTRKNRRKSILKKTRAKKGIPRKN